MTCHVLLISGSLRVRSVNSAVLKAVQEIAVSDITASVYGAMSRLPHFNPDDDRNPLDPRIAALRSDIARADALLFSTPEYAGGLPGSLKNLLDWTVGGVEMNKKPVAWINTASLAAPAGGEDAHASLRKVMGYIGAHIVETACIRIPMSRQDVAFDGMIGSDSIRSQIAHALMELINVAKKQHG